MKSMNIVITMAGNGQRFKDAGYIVPKYEITAHTKTLFEWSMSSLSGFFVTTSKYIFVALRQDNATEFIKNICEKMGIGPIEIIEIDHVTDGQATTALLASSVWINSHELLIYNIDTYVEPGNMNYKQIKGDGFLPCFEGGGDHWSFVKLNEEGLAVEVAEKTRISKNCTVGAYYFKNAALYQRLYTEYYLNKIPLDKTRERYIAPLYNQLICESGEVYISNIPKQYVHVLGTPSELDDFVNNYHPV
jgi:dTDP-glucose pyrophosphorylase